jgi:hypothetical protein
MSKVIGVIGRTSQFDDDWNREISSAVDYSTIADQPFEPSKMRILNCEKTMKAKRLRPRRKNTPGRSPWFLNLRATAGRKDSNEKAHRPNDDGLVLKNSRGDWI